MTLQEAEKYCDEYPELDKAWYDYRCSDDHGCGSVGDFMEELPIFVDNWFKTMCKQLAIHHITGETCFIIESECECCCHLPGSNMMHIVACCDNGVIRKYEFIKEIDKRQVEERSTE